jgi:hypothetical protein
MAAPERCVRLRSGVLLLRLRETNRHDHPLSVLLATDVDVCSTLFTLRRHRQVPTTTRGGPVVVLFRGGYRHLHFSRLLDEQELVN